MRLHEEFMVISMMISMGFQWWFYGSLKTNNIVHVVVDKSYWDDGSPIFVDHKHRTLLIYFPPKT